MSKVTLMGALGTPFLAALGNTGMAPPSSTTLSYPFNGENTSLLCPTSSDGNLYKIEIF